jgi:hypothetical protein
MKKPFNETKFGQFIKKAGQHVPDVLDVGLNFIGGDIKGSLQSVKNIISGSDSPKASELLEELKLKQYHYLEEFRIEVDDRKNAREREKEYVKIGKRDYMQVFVSLMVFIPFVYMLIMLFSGEIPNNNKDLINILIGMVATSFVSIVAYYFGSSKGSRDKDIISKKSG